MKGPDEFVAHLGRHQYHPRSDAHSNAICTAILRDLLSHCPPLAQRAQTGEIVASLNHTATISYQRWNIDLALGRPASAAEPPSKGESVRFDTPALIEVAMEAKGVMTEHGKARHNRLRDLQAFHHHAHMYNQQTVAVGVVVVNVAPVYWSPTRDPEDITEHTRIDQLGKETVDLFRNLPLRNSSKDGPGLEAACVVVVSHDNLKKNPALPAGAPAPSDSVLVERSPAPPIGDPLNYATMIHRICRAYQDRWV